MEPRRKCFTCGTASSLLRFPERFEVGQREKLDVHFVSLKKIWPCHEKYYNRIKAPPHSTNYYKVALRIASRARQKKEFADKTCVRRPTSAMPKPSFSVHQPSAVPFHGGVLVAAGCVSVVCRSGDVMCYDAVYNIIW